MYAPRVRRCLRVCAGALLSQVASFGIQQKQPDTVQSAPFKFETKVKEVLVPTLVLDSHGHAVGNLRQQDFQIFDKGKKQIITGFTVQTRGDLGTAPAVDTPVAQQLASPSEASPPASTSIARHHIAFLFDDLHIAPGDLVQVRKAASRVMANCLKGTAMVAVLSTSGRTNTGFTRDEAKLQEAIAGLRSVMAYSHPRNDCPDIDHYEAYLILYVHDPQAMEVVANGGERCAGIVPDGTDIHDHAQGFTAGVAMAAAEWEMPRGEQATHFTLEAIRQIVRQMGNLRGQRTLILISPGFIALTPAAADAQSRAIDTAAQANVTISTLDARGLSTDMEHMTKVKASRTLDLFMRQDRIAFGAVMAQLADGTGGRYLQNSNDFAGGLSSLSEAPEYLYLLQFSPSGDKQDGSFHALKVKVNVKGVKIRSRRGYFAPPAPQPNAK